MPRRPIGMRRNISRCSATVVFPQLVEVASPRELLFVIRDASLHQHAADPVFRLNALSDQQVSITQDAPAVADLTRSQITLREVVATQKIRNLLRVHAIVFLLTC